LGYFLQQLLTRYVVVGQAISIDVLPDDVLLAIFDFCVNEDSIQLSRFSTLRKKVIEVWQPLVHVCRRWRSVIFGSPRRLNLRLVCSAKTPARDTLDVWPAFPLHIQGSNLEGGIGNIIAALEHSDRVCRIDLWGLSSSHLEKLLAAMQVPFPELTYMELRSYGEVALPESFLGGSAPRLRLLYLDNIPFPGLPKLLLSATHLFELRLEDIPQSGYISPEAMVTALSTSTRLNSLVLRFQPEFPLSLPDRPPPPPTRSVLSFLTYFEFKGLSEYLDDLVACIDAPRLDQLNIYISDDFIFDTPQLIQFICRTPRLKTLEKAHVTFDADVIAVGFSSPTSGANPLEVEIFSCRELDLRVWSMVQLCTLSLPPLSTLEDLYIYGDLSSQAHWQDNIENARWLELLQPFRAVKNLYLSEKIALCIVPALQELVGSRATEVLPTLQNIFLERLEPSGPIQEGIWQFVATRQVTSDPIAVSLWDRGQDSERIPVFLWDSGQDTDSEDSQD
jgi:hypothetical protein